MEEVKAVCLIKSGQRQRLDAERLEGIGGAQRSNLQSARADARGEHRDNANSKRGSLLNCHIVDHDHLPVRRE